MEDHHNLRRSATTDVGDGAEHPTPLRWTIRILCHRETAGGVVGCYGSIVKQLERATGAKIKLDENRGKSMERVISVTGNTLRDRTMVLNGEKWDVSELQEGLVRVFERILELESSGSGKVGCRVLARRGQAAAVIGTRGDVIKMLDKRLAVRIRILPPDQLPECASAGDELIQIMGNAMAVKKSLIAFACQLQGKAIREKVLRGKYLYKGFSGNLNEHSSVDRPQSAENNRILESGRKTCHKLVEFRLLCSHDVAGGLIGWQGTLVKALEEELGASIRLSSPAAARGERIVTIASIEHPGQLNSPAQIAVMRVFARSIEVENELEPASDLVTDRNITAQVLLASDQVSCLIDTEGMISSNICTATGAQMQLSWGSSAVESDNVLQISGLYENVKNALLQVTCRLRNIMLSSITDSAEPMHNSYSSDFSIVSSERENTVIPGSDYFVGLSPIDHDKTLIQEMEQFGFLDMSNEGNSTASSADTAGGFGKTESNLEQKSGEFVLSTNITEEIEVPVQVIGCVYGKSGTNLARLKQISGASIILEYPPPGKGYVKVIITGTLVSIQVARSLVQACMLPEQ